jgi:hypothetical protein
VGEIPEPRIMKMISSLPGSGQTLPGDLELIRQNDFDLEGLTFEQIAVILPDMTLELIPSLLASDALFWYNTRIGLRPSIPFAVQKQWVAPNPALLYELVLELLSGVTLPMSFEDITKALDGCSFLRLDGQLGKVDSSVEQVIESFLTTSPMIVRMGPLYYLLPLESEVDLFGGLYVRELHYMMKLYGPYPSTWQAMPDPGFLRYPVSDTEAVFLFRVPKWRELLMARFWIVPDPRAIPPRQLFCGLHTIVAHYPLPLAPFKNMKRIKRDPLPLVEGANPIATTKALAQVVSQIANTEVCQPLTIREIVKEIPCPVICRDGQLRRATDRDVTDALQGSYEWRKIRSSRWIPFGFTVLRPPQTYDSPTDAIVAALTLLHLTSGFGGAVFPWGVLEAAVVGLTYSVAPGESAVLAKDGLRELVERLAAEGAPWWINRDAVGLIRFSPDAPDTVFTPSDTWTDDVRQRRAIACAEPRPPIDQDVVDFIRELGVIASDLPEGCSLSAFLARKQKAASMRRRIASLGEWPEPERWKVSPPTEPQETISRASTVSAPLILGWRPPPDPRPTPDFATAVKQLRKSEEWESLDTAVQKLQPLHGGTEWECCCATVRVLGELEARRPPSVEKCSTPSSARPGDGMRHTVKPPHGAPTK